MKVSDVRQFLEQCQLKKWPDGGRREKNGPVEGHYGHITRRISHSVPRLET